MALYIDPPRWPAHGTLFSHLVSDRSYQELHTAAAELGLPSRAFEEDHYDVPARLYGAALELGALAVSGGDLIRVLRDSGLRVPARERIERVLPELRRRWNHGGLGEEHLREDLLQRWTQVHRQYHTPVHLLECLEAIDELAPEVLGIDPPRELLLAAWFHDAVYDGVPGSDEERSALLAEEQIGGDLGAEVARLVRLTKDHRVAPDDLVGAVLVDADLAILAAPRVRYDRYVAQVRSEYAQVPDEQWRAGRGQVLRSFRDRTRLYAGVWAEREWRGRVQENLESELRGLECYGKE